MLLHDARTAPLPPGRALPLDDGAAWRVTEGSVDVFTSLDGVRRFLFAAGPGAVLWGTPPGIDGRILEAVAWDGAVVGRLDRAPTPAEVEGWLAGLLDGAAHGLLPHPAADRRLRPGDTAQARPAEVLSTRAGVAWLTAAEAPLMLGLDGPHGLVPVTPLSWATSTTAGPVECLDTAAVLARPDGLAQVAAATACAVSVLSLKDSLGRADELIRRRERERRDHEGLARAGLAPPPAEPGDPLLAVVRTLVAPLGVAVRRPVRVRAVDADKPLTLEEIAEASGLRARRVRLPAGWWRRDIAPLLAWRHDGTPVAVVGRSLVDAAGAAIPLTADTAARLRPDGHVLHRRLPGRWLRWPEVLAFDLPRGDIAVLALGGVVAAGLAAGVPMALGRLFAGLPMRDGPAVAAALLVAALAAGLFAALSEVARLRLEGRQRDGLGGALWDRLLGLPLPTLRRSSAGTLAARAEAPLAVQDAWRRLLAAAPLAAGLAGGGLAVLGLTGTAGIGATLFAAVVALSAATGLARGRLARGAQAAAGRAHGLLFQMMSGLSRIRLAAAEDRAFLVWLEQATAARRPRARARWLGAAGHALLAAVPLAGVAWLLDALRGAEPGATVAALAAVAPVLVAAARLGSGLDGLAAAWPQAEVARPLLDTPPEPSAGRVDPGRLSGEIEVAGLTFSYGGDAPPVLDGVGFHVPPGAFVAIVGPSGSGKSTLLRLLLGLETAQAGAVFYDGFDLRGLDLGAVRRQVGTVLQGGRLMPGSILDIVRGDSGAGLDAVRQAIDAAGLGPDVAALPMGLHTLVADGARTLSGGQVQRLLLARALAARPPVFLLDEATSALDNRTQARVLAHLAGMSATRVVVAHRLSTIAEADHILVLEGGRIVESGTWATLLAANGRLARMHALQGTP
ncbi:ATP-binding cassette domain-containing protein [Novispirillum sp. DQ9]|uniref:ATP-binding cassette domain-containing protein n=1 Tax=Novispirillum sp. DQ9 TaxID=3398612 RepID=UPI003C7BD53C